MDLAVIGGGAAGFFAAIHAKQNHPETSVTLFEKSNKLLSKVRISGGGRCNVTNGCTSVNELCEAYPRGGKRLKKAFHRFNTTHTRAWFESRGVQLKKEDDGRVFPVSNDSQTIIDCLMQEMRRLKIDIKLKTPVQRIHPQGSQLGLIIGHEEQPRLFDKVIVATGGSPEKKRLAWLEELGHKIEDPVPSLFTFNMPAEPITTLMGVVAENVQVNIQGTKLKSEGPLLITHWGMSGPAILKLSAFGARILSERGYTFKVQVNWVHEINHEKVADYLKDIIYQHDKKLLSSIRPYFLPKKLWQFLLEKSALPADKKWGELGKKGINKLVTILTNDTYDVSGKTTFKEEFVTCGGISLQSVDMNTMQSKVCKNLYFAGEVLDIDGITGGYNFQAAWTTGYIAGLLGS